MAEFKPVSLKRMALFLAGLFAMSLVLGFGTGFLAAGRPGLAQSLANSDGLVLGAFVALVVLMAAAFAISAGWMRSIDEAAQEAHKSAWYWGGSAGLAVGGVFIILAALPQAARWGGLPALWGRSDPAAYAATGAFALMTLMMAGYGIAWAIWWRMRG